MVKLITLPERHLSSFSLGKCKIFWLPRELNRSHERAIKEELTHYHGNDDIFASEQKTQEFRRSRWLMRQVIQKHAKLPPSLPPKLPHDIGGDILWPEGTYGSLSHCQGVVAFTFGEKASTRGDTPIVSVGIDVEKRYRLQPKIADKVFSKAELNYFETMCELNRDFDFLTAGFSAKEALFKAIYPRVRSRFYFHDAEIMSFILGQDGSWTFLINMLVPLGGQGHSTWAIGDQISVMGQVVRCGNDNYLVTACENIK